MSEWGSCWWGWVSKGLFTHSSTHTLTHLITHSFTHLLTCSCTHLLIELLTQQNSHSPDIYSPNLSLTYLTTHPINHSPEVLFCQSPTQPLMHNQVTHSITYPLIHSLTHLLTQTLMHTFTHSLTYSLTYKLTHSYSNSVTHSLTHPNSRTLTHSSTHSSTQILWTVPSKGVHMVGFM